jgi:hypothetical protein
LENEYSEIEQFLYNFSQKLILGSSPESAFLTAAHAHKGDLTNALKQASLKLLHNSTPLTEIWDIIINELHSKEGKRLLILALKSLNRSPTATGEQLVLLVNQIRKNQILLKERQGILSTLMFKTRLLIIVAAITLGVISSLTPFLELISRIDTIDFIYTGIQLIPYEHFFPLIFTISISLGLVAYNAENILGSRHPYSLPILAITLHLISFETSRILLNLFSMV